jgi:CsoR family transcriptional regulator, copper-sensing transcriptional repressor
MSTVPDQHIEVVKKAAIVARLKSIEGQARGVEHMLDEDRSCVDIIDQLAALRGATQAVCLQALQIFAAHCLRLHATDQEEVLAKVLDAISRMTR